MPRNRHDKEVVYESPEGTKTLYATHTNWYENHVLIHHYPDYNDQKFLHEDTVSGIRSQSKEIPTEKVYEINSIEI